MKFTSFTMPFKDNLLFLGEPNASAALTVGALKKLLMVPSFTSNVEVLNTCHINNKHSLYSNSSTCCPNVAKFGVTLCTVVR